jgi:hypothetical protein
MTVNEELKSTVRNLAIKSVELLLSHANEYVPDYRSAKYKHLFQSPFSMRKLESISEVLFNTLVLAYRNDIERLSEFRECTKILESDQMISKKIHQ